MRKTFLPTDFRDWLSLISFIGFIGIFLEFGFEKTLISDSMTALFLLLGGFGLMVLGKVFQIGKWTSDGIQKNEQLQVLAIIVGGSSSILGALLLFDVPISIKYMGLVAVIALFPALFILIDYWRKNQ